jgi:pimeloyl-ACP methyl ester carboxylesterase
VGKALHCRELGRGPAVVLVHGVGVGAWSFAEVADVLAQDHRVVLPDRRGYGDSATLPRPGSFADHVDDLAAVLDGRGLSRATVVGVSGGATLAVGLAIAHPRLVRAAVAHEPALGRRAPELDARLRIAAADLEIAPEADAGASFVAGLVGGDAWAGLDPDHRALVGRLTPVIRREVPQFLAFAPTSEELHRARAVALVTTVGARSAPSRHAAAAALGRHAGAVMRVLPGVAHLPQLEDPRALVRAVRLAERLHRGARGDQEVLPAGGRDELEADRQPVDPPARHRDRREAGEAPRDGVA